jgi:hypothetical protein
MSKVSKSDKRDASSAGEGDDAEAPGEGNRAADRRYREATEKFVAEGRVEPAADEARRAMDDPDEREELERAEEIGRSRAREHDPELHKP